MAQSLCQDLDQKLRMDRGDYGQETFSAGADHQLNELHENYGCISVTLSHPPRLRTPGTVFK